MQNKPNHTEKINALQRFGLFFFGRRETTLTFWVAIIIFGVASYTTLMQRQGFPNVDVPISVVSGTYFVNDKSKVDSDITKPASRAVASMPEVKTVRSQAGDNFFSLVIEYKDGTSSKEGSALVASVLNNTLPASAKTEYKPVEGNRFAEQSDLLLSISMTNPQTTEQLQERAKTIATEMKDVEGVQKAMVLTQVEQGVNPFTGEPTSQQRSFDRIGFRDGSGAVVFYNSVVIGIQAKPSTDALKLYDEVKNKIELIKSEDAYSDVRVTISADFAEGIRSQISNLQKSLFEGLLVVIVVSCLLISWRAGLATALSMATVLLMTIGALYASGTTLNTITLFALILSLGLIVDDTTIMVEAIDAAGARNPDKRIVVQQAIKRVARASFAGTVTTMLAFAPMIFISGVLGSFIRILPISIILALAVSYVVSVSLVPFFAHFLVHSGSAKPTRNPVAKAEKFVSGLLSRHVRAGETSRKKRWLYGGSAILISVIFFAGSIPYFGRLKFDIFPNTKDGDDISVVLVFTDGQSISDAQITADKADIVIGDTLGKNLKRLSYQSSGSSSNAKIEVQLVPYTSREVTSPELVKNVTKAFEGFEGASVKVSQIDAGPPKDDYPFNMRVYEDDTAKATVFAKDLESFLGTLKVQRANGTSASVSRTQESNSSAIVRSEGRRYIAISAGFDATDTSALLAPAKKAVNEKFTPLVLEKYGLNQSQIDFDFGNEANNQDSFKSMLFAFPILFGVMFLLLLLQFRSFLQPLLIFTAVPFSFFGVAAGLYYTDNPLSFFVLVGFFALIGIAVNNTILLTDYANQARDVGANKYEAMSQAVAARFRPLITTSLTSVVALIPLALSDPFWQSLAVTLIFGLLSSTLLVIVAFPYLYLGAEWLRVQGTRWWLRALPRPLQQVFDVVFFPVRLIRFLLWIIFSWPKRAPKAILK